MIQAKIAVLGLAAVLPATAILAQGVDSLASQSVTAPRLDIQRGCRFPKLVPDPTRSDEEQGSAVIGLLVGLDGRVRDTRIDRSSGNSVNDRIIAGAFADCSYTTAGPDGKPMTEPAWTQVTYRWRLNGNTTVPASRPEYQTYLARFYANASLRQEVERRVAQSPQIANGACAGMDYQIPEQPQSLEPLKFNMVGHVTAGLLKYAVPAKGCGEATTINIFIQVRKEQSIDPVTGVPGGTRVPLAQQKEVTAEAFVEASLLGRRDPDCETRYVVDTALIGEPPAQGAAWRERWTLARCEMRYTVPLLISPSAGGEQVSASLAPDESVTVSNRRAP